MHALHMRFRVPGIDMLPGPFGTETSITRETRGSCRPPEGGGEPAPLRRLPSLRHFGRNAHRFEQIAMVGDVPTRDVERGAVSRRGANQRRPMSRVTTRPNRPT